MVEPVAKITREQAAKELDFELKDENLEGMFNGFAEMRRLVDSIPTPGTDAGEAGGNFSAFALVKDILGGTLGLMEAPLKGVTPEKVFEDTLKMGAGMTGVNLAKGGVGASVGMFGSRPSSLAGKKIHETFNAQLKRAQELETLAKDPEYRTNHNIASDKDVAFDIWKVTGMSKDHRGDWRYSIVEDIDNPGQARINWDVYDRDVIDPLGNHGPMVLEDILVAPKAYEHWPELKSVSVVMDNTQSGMGSYNPIANTITINPIRIMQHDDPNQALRTLVHEAQHALQTMQERPMGAGTSWIAKAMDERIDSFRGWMERESTRAKTNTELAAIRKYHQVQEAWERMQRTFGREMAAYWASPGEIEARLAEAMAASPKWIGKAHPDSFEAKNAASAPDKENIFEPADVKIPSLLEKYPDPSGPTDAGKKAFGTKGTQQMIIPEDRLELKRLEKQLKEQTIQDSDRKVAELYRDDILSKLEDEALWHEAQLAKYSAHIAKGVEAYEGQFDLMKGTMENHLKAVKERRDLIIQHGAPKEKGPPE